MLYFLSYIYFSSFISLLLIRKHVFLCLLSLEYIVVSLLTMYLYYFFFFNGFYLMIIMMVLFVCEGVLGLSVLVSMIRCYGNDYVSSMTLW